ncbi:MAG: Zn-ribbon domain-containing OB-fold protein [bacterium]
MGTERDYSRLLTVTWANPMPYEWSIGKYGSLFFHEMKRSRRFVGSRCPGCGKVYVPPRRICGPCFLELDEIVRLPDTGKITAFSVVNYPFIDPDTGEQRPIPYTYGYIRIDGSDTIFSHLIHETDVARIRVGMKVRAVFKDPAEMQGNIRDIRWFEIVDPG